MAGFTLLGARRGVRGAGFADGEGCGAGGGWKVEAGVRLAGSL